MYIKITKSLLKKLDNTTICALFEFPLGQRSQTKAALIKFITEQEPVNLSIESDEYNTYVLICEFCRNKFFLNSTSKVYNEEPHVCVFCGKVAPKTVFIKKIDNSKELLKLANSNNKKHEKATQKTLIEQSLVSFITNFEVYLRTTYSLYLDYDHVIFGKTIFDRIYKETRNQFLNLGQVNRRIKPTLSVDLKQTLTTTDYAFLSNMYSARHVVVHNNGIIDREYISQTNGDETQLRKDLCLKISDVRRLIKMTEPIVKKINSRLNESLLNHIKNTYKIEQNITEE